MGAADGRPRVWAEMGDEDLRDQLRHYLFLAANRSNRHAGRIVQPVPEAGRCGKAQMVDEAMQWVKSYEPSKQ